MSIQPDWLRCARKLQALAQTALTYAENQYDKECDRQLESIAAEIFSAHTGQPLATIEQWFAIQPGYATPKVDVRGACFRDGKVLLVREKADGAWCLPGGWADVGDVPSNAAEREVREEAGFECVARKAIGIFDCNRTGCEPLASHHAFKLIFSAKLRAADQTPTTKFWKWISSRATIFHRSRCLARTARACSNVSRIWMTHIDQWRSISHKGYRQERRTGR
jgi:ADP-ribose pyrophosphatase YjhB (NUDIX family)